MSSRPAQDRVPWFHSLGFRLALGGLVLVFLPALAVTFLDTYERQLLTAQERTMVHLGRALAAALEGPGFRADGAWQTGEVRALVRRLAQRHEGRIRVLDEDGAVLADSSLLDTRPAPETLTDRRSVYTDSRASPASPESAPPQDSWLYQLGALPSRVWRRLTGRVSVLSEDAYGSRSPLQGPEIRAALAGRYGSATRLSSDGSASVTLYSALPIPGRPRAAVLVSQSTARLLADLYALRVAALQVVLAASALAGGLALLWGLTLSRPLGRLAREARQLEARLGPGEAPRFSASRRQDEIGALSRALSHTAARLAEHRRFTEGLTADMTHELRNPLAALSLALENLETLEDDPVRARFLASLKADLARMQALITGLRDLGRAEGRQAGAAEALDLRAETEAGLAEFAARRGHPVRVRFEGQPRALWPAWAWRRVLDNLLENAADFSPDRVPLELQLGPEALLQVRDRGPGLPPGREQEVFGRFVSFRPAPGPGQPYHPGLGLALARRLTEVWGGQITASSAQPGACFTLDLRDVPASSDTTGPQSS